LPASAPCRSLCEKPLFTDPLDAPRLAALRAAYPAPIWVAMEYRYMPPVAHLLREAQAATGGVKMLTIREHRFPFLSKGRRLEPLQPQLGRDAGGKVLPFLRPDAAGGGL
jgi:predicted dehydrogenase